MSKLENDRPEDVLSCELGNTSSTAKPEALDANDPTEVSASAPPTNSGKVELQNAGHQTSCIPNPLLKHSLLGSAAELEKLAVEQKPLLGDLCAMGETSVWYASHGTGKTLLMIRLLVDAVQSKRISPAKVFYVNCDDSGSGLATKVRILDDLGIHVLAQDRKGFRARDLLSLLQEMIDTGTAHGVFLILDTMKKFVQVMDKKESSTFGEMARRFSSAGGTLLALAHTNKRPDANGKSIYGGTSDIMDDFDSGYVIDCVGEDKATGDRIIEFTCKKNRGGTAAEARYAYSPDPKLTYLERLTSVRPVDGDGYSPEYAPLPGEPALIVAIQKSIHYGHVNKMNVLHCAAKATRSSQRKVLAVIEKYTGDDPLRHIWNYEVRDRGAKVFSLLNPDWDPSVPAL